MLYEMVAYQSAHLQILLIPIMTSGEPVVDNERDKLTTDLLTGCMWSVGPDNTGVGLDNI